MKNVILMFVFIFLAACSSGGGGGEETVQPLSDDQKKILKVVGQEITDVSLATRDYTDLSFTFRNGFEFKEFTEHRLGISQKGEQYKNELGIAEASDKCKVVKSGLPKAGEPVEELDVEVEVADSDTGKCAFYSKMLLEYVSSENVVNNVVTSQKKVTSEAEFEVLESASLFLAMDMTKFTSNYTAEESSITTASGLVENSKAEGTGTFISKSQGAFSFQIRGSSTGTYSSKNDVDVKKVLTTIYQLKDFTAVGIIRGTQTDVDKKVEYKYFVNSEEVKEREYRKYFGDRVGHISVDIN